MKKKLILILIIFTFKAAAQLVLPSIFSDNMVLQRNMGIPVWGKCAPGAKVVVNFHSQEKVTTADKEGDWKLLLSPISADSPSIRRVFDNPQKMSIESGNSRIDFTNVVVGEVWLCSGQSNMKFPLRQAYEAEKYILKAQNDKIRFFQDYRYGFKPYECNNCAGDWKVCTTNSVKNLTAIGYFFGLELYHRLNVPIGLIQIEYSGTIIESWMNANDLQEWDIYKEALTSLSKYKNSKRFSYLKEKEKKEWLDKLKKLDPGFENNWMSHNFNDSGWGKIYLPHAWDSPYLKGHIGSVWYRKKFIIPQKWNNKELMLSLGLIQDHDLVWLNGKLIGMTLGLRESKWNRLYKIKSNDFKTGENTVVICNIGHNNDAGPVGHESSMKICLKAARSNSVQLAGEWLCKKGNEGKEITELPIPFTLGRNTLSVNYNSRIHPVIPFAIRGAIWYQGESNRHNSERYEDLFTTLIKSWRDEWQEGDFPFYFVQIAPFNYGEMYNSAYVQEAQFHALKVTNTGMAVTMDIELKGIK